MCQLFGLQTRAGLRQASAPKALIKPSLELPELIFKAGSPQKSAPMALLNQNLTIFNQTFTLAAWIQLQSRRKKFYNFEQV
jgi:hypothetical protein